MSEGWKTIPGYDGMYQAAPDGRIRTWRWRGSKRMQQPRLMRAYDKQGRGAAYKIVKLTADGKGCEVKVAHLIWETFRGEIPEGMSVYHLNGVYGDNHIANLALENKKHLGRKTGHKAKARAVARINADGEMVDVFRSSREASRKLGQWGFPISYQTILDRCNGKVKRDELIAGYTFRWAEQFEELPRGRRKIIGKG